MQKKQFNSIYSEELYITEDGAYSKRTDKYYYLGKVKTFIVLPNEVSITMQDILDNREKIGKIVDSSDAWDRTHCLYIWESEHYPLKKTSFGLTQIDGEFATRIIITPSVTLIETENNVYEINPAIIQFAMPIRPKDLGILLIDICGISNNYEKILAVLDAE